MTTLLWIAAVMLAVDLMFVWRGAVKRESQRMTPTLAVVYTLTRGFYITVLVLAATKGVTP